MNLSRWREYFWSRKVLWVWVLVYVCLVVSQITWGLPTEKRVFVYQMDEWHQWMAMINVLKFGTSNMAGSANGPIGHFLVSGLMSAPMLGWVYLRTGGLKVLFEMWQWQRALFVYLRLETMVFGVGALMVMDEVLRKHFSELRFWGIFFWVMSGGWLTFSGYFKYDIALVFWMVLTILKMLDFGESRKRRDYLWAGIFAGMAMATKASAPPLLVVYGMSFWWFEKDRNKWRDWLWGLGGMSMVILLVGVPDAWLGLGDYREFLWSNLVSTPKVAADWNYVWWQVWVYVGEFLEASFGVGAVVLVVMTLVKVDWKKKKEGLLWLWLIVFGMFMWPLGLSALGNRLLVLVPVVSILAGKGMLVVVEKKWWLVVGLLVLGQCYSALSWVAVKWQVDPRESMSDKVTERLDMDPRVGYLGNVMYEKLPDVMMWRWWKKGQGDEKKLELVDMGLKSEKPEWAVITNAVVGENQVVSERRRVLDWMGESGYSLVCREYSPLPRWYWWGWEVWGVVPPRLVPQPHDISVYKR